MTSGHRMVEKRITRVRALGVSEEQAVAVRRAWPFFEIDRYLN